jgi:hypothetical protein
LKVCVVPEVPQDHVDAVVRFEIREAVEIEVAVVSPVKFDIPESPETIDSDRPFLGDTA